MTPEIVDRDELIVVGIRSVLEIDAGAVAALWKEHFFPRRGEVAGADNMHYGVFNFLPAEDGKPPRCEYVAGVMQSLDSIPEGMVGWIIPAGKYARIRAKGLADIPCACRDLLAEWMPDSGFKQMDSPVFIRTAAARPDAPDAEWEINIPVETPEELENLRHWGLYKSTRRFSRDENGIHEVQ